ncbi:unnamed protein product [Amoebophrya sp. A25]|nr:unnamed protein product [Amoebophrya sp. A25]|eukprot:GSA25T00013555001.1
MRLDTSILRYLTKDDFRVLTAIEMGQKNHEFVPTQLIETISNLRRGGCRKVLSLLLKHKLVVHDGKKYDGYKLTYNGYDFLALKAFMSRGHIEDVRMTRIGVGKEADVHICYDKDGNKLALKLHRLGRVSFRSIKNNRDYLQHRKHASWMYLSRLAATKEYAYAKALSDAGFRVPRAIDHNRHAILMEFIDAFPLYHMRTLGRPERVMASLFRLLLRLARSGLIHGDFNEFNLMINTDEKITLIDFPQIVTMEHENAEFYFERDVGCVLRFFRKRFGLECEEFPTYEEAREAYESVKAATNQDNEVCDEDEDHAFFRNDRLLPPSSAGGQTSSRSNKPTAVIQLGAGALLESEDMLLLDTIKEEAEHEVEEEEDDEGSGGEEEEDDDEEECSDESDAECGDHDGEEEEADHAAVPEGGCRIDHLCEGFTAQMTVSSAKDTPSSSSSSSPAEAFSVGGNPNHQLKIGKMGNRCSKEAERSTATDVNSDESSDDSSDEEAPEGGGGAQKIEDQIHVLQRRKIQRKILTADEIRNKLKQKEKQQKFKNCNKNKMQMRMKDDAKAACRGDGGGW